MQSEKTFSGPAGVSGFLVRHQTLSAFIVFIFLAAYALGANPFAGETVGPFDLFLQFPGWSSVQERPQMVHFERSDIIDSLLPVWVFMKKQIRSGNSPLWYPYADGGVPVSFEMFDPFFLLFTAFEDNAFAFYLAGLAKLTLAALGAYLLLRSFVGWLPSVWGGSVFMLSGFNAAWFFWCQVSTAVWIPWLLWATVMYLRTDDLIWLPVVTVTSLLLILGGYPAVTAFGVYAFLLLILVWRLCGGLRSRWSEKTGPVTPLGVEMFSAMLPLAAAGLALVIAAVALVPFFDSLQEIDFRYRIGGRTSFSLRDLQLFFRYETPPRVERSAYIGMPVMLLAFMGVLNAFRSGNERLTRFIIFNGVLVVCAILIAFGLLPHGLIRSIPVFHNNPWGRLVVVALLGLAVLSAVGLDCGASMLAAGLKRYGKMPRRFAAVLVTVIVLVLAVFQFQTQKKFFNSFNGAVPSAWFYPSTPSIDYVKGRLRPLQSVIADDSYWFAGTLGAYGISEWYGHSFRTEKEKEVLGRLVLNPFSSPTSMYINGYNIQLNSPLMDRLAIKYLLVNKALIGRETVFQLPETSHIPASPLPDNIWRQHIRVPNNIVVGNIGFWFATYREKHAPAGLRLTLLNAVGRVLAEADLDGTEIRDNEWGNFRFPRLLPLEKGRYTLHLSMPGYSGPKKLTAWATVNLETPEDFLEVNGMNTYSSLIYRMTFYENIDTSALNDKWDLLGLERAVAVLENRNVTNSVYLVKDLDDQEGRIDFSGIEVAHPSTDMITINYSKPDAGWIVLPMHLNPGWKAYVDGRQVSYETYLGILPAIPVKGAGRITFHYSAKSFRTGAVVSLFGLSIFALCSYVIYRRRSGKGPGCPHKENR